jgi:hypothetical protein
VGDALSGANRDGDLTIFQAIGEVIEELGGIGKTGRNEDQHYNFRGIDGKRLTEAEFNERVGK